MAMLPVEFKTFPFELKSVDEDQGIVEGYLSTFGNVDSQKDRVVKGAFKKTLTEAKSRMQNRGKKYLWPVLWMHDPEKPLGGCLDAYEDDHGLYTKFQLDISTNSAGIPNNPLATMVFSGYKNGYIDEQSMGYKAIQKAYDREGVRDLKECQIWEESCITSLFAANDEAQATSVKIVSGKDEGNIQMLDLQSKNFHDYYHQRQIADWLNRWFSLTQALKSSVMDAFNVGDTPAQDVESALNGSDDSPGFITALMNWVDDGIALNASEYFKQVDSNPWYYMERADQPSTKAGAVVSQGNKERLQEHVDTLVGMKDMLHTVAEDITSYLTGNDAYAPADHGETGSHADSSKTARLEPQTALNQPPNSTEIAELEQFAAWLQSQVKSAYA